MDARRPANKDASGKQFQPRKKLPRCGCPVAFLEGVREKDAKRLKNKKSGLAYG